MNVGQKIVFTHHSGKEPYILATIAGFGIDDFDVCVFQQNGKREYIHYIYSHEWQPAPDAKTKEQSYFLDFA